MKNDQPLSCDENCSTEKNASGLSCKLTTRELQQRKATVIASLENKIIRKEELPEGFSYTFAGTDELLDELTEFIKTERACCDFFTFSLTVKGDPSEIVLQLTGPEGAKAFIVSELDL